MTIIRNAHVVTPGKDLGVTDVVVEGDRIVSVGKSAFRRNAPTEALAARGCNSPNCTEASAVSGCNSPNCTEASAVSGCNSPNCTEASAVSGCNSPNCTVIDATGLTLIPGFVDIHSHGRGGADFCDATDEAFETIGRGKLQDGVTSFLATGLTQSEETLAELCRCVERYRAKCASRMFDSDGGRCSSPPPVQFGELHPRELRAELRENDRFPRGRISPKCAEDASSPGGRISPKCAAATCLGVHLEGPFFNPAMAGAQNPAFLRDPDADFVLRLHAISRVLKVSLAPELPGAEACIRRLRAAGIVASLGHSSADYETFERARAAGATHLTHFCNAMMPIHHLRPTMVTGGLLADDVFCEIITDGVHLSDPMIRLIAKTKGPDRLMIITDAMCAAGEPDGIYSLGGLRVKVEKGKATLADVPYDPKAVVSNVAGSVALFPQCFQRFVRVTGWPLHEAVKAAGYNQLRSLGITDRGEVKKGQIADLVLLDGDLNPQCVICRGVTIPVGAFPRNAQIGMTDPTAGVVQARLPGSSANCPHESFAPGCGDTATSPVGAFASNAPLESYNPPSPGFYCRFGHARVWHGDLPHWQQANVATFVTLRAAGSLPQKRLDELREFDETFRGRISPKCAGRMFDFDGGRCSSPPSGQFGELPPRELRARLRENDRFSRGRISPKCADFPRGRISPKCADFSRGRISPKCAEDPEWQDYLRRRRQMVEKWLDADEGPSPFATEEVRRALEEALWKRCPKTFDLYSFVVKPNHLHVLLQPHDDFLERDLAAFKRYTARIVNLLNGTTGAVWQREHYDTLVRDEEHFRFVRDYIWKNDPRRAWDFLRCDGAFRRNAPTGEEAGAFRRNAPTGILRG